MLYIDCHCAHAEHDFRLDKIVVLQEGRKAEMGGQYEMWEKEDLFAEIEARVTFSLFHFTFSLCQSFIPSLCHRFTASGWKVWDPNVCVDDQ